MAVERESARTDCLRSARSWSSWIKSRAIDSRGIIESHCTPKTMIIAANTERKKIEYLYYVFNKPERVNDGFTVKKSSYHLSSSIIKTQLRAVFVNCICVLINCHTIFYLFLLIFQFFFSCWFTNVSFGIRYFLFSFATNVTLRKESSERILAFKKMWIAEHRTFDRKDQHLHFHHKNHNLSLSHCYSPSYIVLSEQEIKNRLCALNKCKSELEIKFQLRR